MPPTTREVLEALRGIHFPPDRRRGVRASLQHKKLGFVLGHVVDYFHGWTASAATRRYPELAEMLCAYARANIPDFKFTSIMVNAGRSALHVDTQNVGPSYITSLGKHQGGHLWQFPDQELRIRNRFVACDGLLPHMTLPYDGDERYSIVYFNMFSRRAPPPAATSRLLRKLGFAPPTHKEREGRPRIDLLPAAAEALRRRGLSASAIGDYSNATLPSR